MNDFYNAIAVYDAASKKWAENIRSQVELAAWVDATYSYSKTDYGPVRPDWWRCDGCGHANDWQHLDCAHCGAQLPTRYDT